MTTHDESPITRTTKKRLAQGLAIVVITAAVGAAIAVPFWNQMAEIPPPASTIVVESPAATETDEAEEGVEESQEAETGEAEGGVTPAAGTIITILEGSAVQGNPDYEPDEAEVPLNDNIVWVNEDTVPHTATSGTGPEDTDSGTIFDTSIINGGEESAPVQITGVEVGEEIPYYCQVHPYMTSMLIVGAASAGGPNTTATSGPTSENASSTGGQGENATSAAGATTTATTNDTSSASAPAPAAPSATEAAAELTIPQGASVQGNVYYEPDPLTVSVGDTIAVNNEDSAPHTVTSGKDATDPEMGQMFDTSIINAGDSGEVVTTDLQPGEYPYFCSVHPYMTGTLTVQ